MCLLWVKILFLFLDEYENLKPFFESKKALKIGLVIYAKLMSTNALTTLVGKDLKNDLFVIF